MKKSTIMLTFILVLIISVPLASLQPVLAAKPTIPTFTLKIVGTAYDVPPTTTTTIDPYTGKEVTTTTNGHRHDDRKIEISIKNQPFKPSTDPNGQQALYYVIEYKGHFTDEWEEEKGSYGAILQSDHIYTVITHKYNVAKYDAGSQLDFRIKAIIGRTYIGQDYPTGSLSWVYTKDDSGAMTTQSYYVDDTSSGWSSVQTLTIPEASSSPPHPSQTTTLPSSSATSGGSQPQSSNQPQPPNAIFTQSAFLLILGIIFGSVIAIVVMILLKRQLKTQPTTPKPPNIDTTKHQTCNLLKHKN